MCVYGYTRAKLRCNKCGAYSGRPNPPLIEEEAPSQNTQVVLERTQIWSWVPMGPENKNDCAGEGQQQFPRPTIPSHPSPWLGTYHRRIFGSWNRLVRLDQWHVVG
jgi:hypothetical protein